MLWVFNTCPLSKNIKELEYLLDKTKIDFDVIVISESRIKKDKSPIDSLNLKGYSHESCPTESAAGGTLLYISNNLSYKPRNDLCIYKSAELESTFVKPQLWLWFAFIAILIWTLMTTTSVIYWISYQRKIKLFPF